MNLLLSYSLLVVGFFCLSATASTDEEDASAQEFKEPLQLCEDNFKDMSAFMLATTRAYGNNPTQADIDEMNALNWCDCLYKKLPFQTKEMEVQSVVNDSIKVEKLAAELGLLKGRKLEDWERRLFMYSLENGESFMTIWGLTLNSCQSEESED